MAALMVTFEGLDKTACWGQAASKAFEEREVLLQTHSDWSSVQAIVDVMGGAWKAQYWCCSLQPVTSFVSELSLLSCNDVSDAFGTVPASSMTMYECLCVFSLGGGRGGPNLAGCMVTRLSIACTRICCCT